MTDNRTTELREKLTERGIEYETNDSMGAFETRWNVFTATQISANANLIMAVTPDQAIAATLGSGMLTSEQVRESIERNAKSSLGSRHMFSDAKYEAIADELNAVLMNGTYIALPTDAAGEPIHVGDVLESTNAFKNWCVVVGIGDTTKHDHIIYVKFEAAGDISQTWASKFIHRKPDAEHDERKAVKR